MITDTEEIQKFQINFNMALTLKKNRCGARITQLSHITQLLVETSIWIHREVKLVMIEVVSLIPK